MAGPLRWLAVRELLEGQPSLTFVLAKGKKGKVKGQPIDRCISHTSFISLSFGIELSIRDMHLSMGAPFDSCYSNGTSRICQPIKREASRKERPPFPTICSMTDRSTSTRARCATESIATFGVL
jgi:hypothetical protein